ncbi:MULTISPECIES: restriction endonuclease [unclassified Paenibacillus]|uniref:5-methylcytosine restriction system specificity protein McrC n=2 Tax=unclassified Paenibacillus TaxID=185978 RepID=UPI002407227C|nr:MULTISPECIES: restriction endonuclease [unclassified Paenibacillus]MDH6478078.1 5-methylcytosine-specific restriction enzyme subunit McrC [Paenibacillus sp. PastH-2]MDH6505812.1 5-methylcytosine-specific restriction enzyme subunit McrC [Paenibacillus sp. PastM-3]MDF9839039.1 5-methylcytosine-specific restriction enzyme subunit McrC [Paenibacillus sp. PastF-2]MDF9845621.1 5-methylcytosine-specific restriction enzyme subunit McrC [Paenibacillus sp. PastM-2]MDF9852193.1 5-methylcytosine-specif
MSNKIPIQNIYYMLCYCSDILPDKEIMDRQVIDSVDLLELFAGSLARKLGRLVKKGLYQEYIPVQENTGNLKGKILFDESIKQVTFINAKLFCSYDELSHDIVHNQIIKSILYRLIKHDSVHEQTKTQLKMIYRYFNEIRLVKLDMKMFNQARIHRNNQQYKNILSICRIIAENWLVDETEGPLPYDAFDRDSKRMWELFEGFVRNFYKEELNNVYHTRRERMKWDIHEIILGSEQYIPGMETDITLSNSRRKIIIDTKFHKDVFSETKSGERKIKPANLYQLYAYLSNSPKKDEMVGMLLYPQTDIHVDLAYRMNGYTIKCATVNLNQHWKGIKERLIELVV